MPQLARRPGLSVLKRANGGKRIIFAAALPPAQNEPRKHTKKKRRLHKAKYRFSLENLTKTGIVLRKS